LILAIKSSIDTLFCFIASPHLLRIRLLKSNLGEPFLGSCSAQGDLVNLRFGSLYSKHGYVVQAHLAPRRVDPDPFQKTSSYAVPKRIWPPRAKDRHGLAVSVAIPNGWKAGGEPYPQAASLLIGRSCLLKNLSISRGPFAKQYKSKPRSAQTAGFGHHSMSRWNRTGL